PNDLAASTYCVPYTIACVSMQTFTSRHHPGTTPLALVYARALSRGFGAMMVAVMVVSVAAMLQQQPIGATLSWTVPLVWLVATGWTLFDLRRTPAEVQLEGAFGLVLSVWDVSVGWHHPPLQTVHTPRRIDGVLHVGIGHTVHRLEKGDWKQFNDLAKALRRASSAAEDARYHRAAGV
ncbi:MAG: hypothetical protein AAF624_07690, partial [Bacteroidota bacterium]